jgi:two-component system copper resistance phosphate regulon response regulator CusR
VRVLVVEDEERIASFLVKGLGSRGYDVVHVRTGVDAMSAATSADVILLDLGLPDMDGLDVLDAIRERRPHVQVIALTARSEVGDRVEGLERGADDYLVKPFAFEELVARIHARGRAAEAGAGGRVRSGDLSLDLRTRSAEVDGREIELRAKEFELLAMLVDADGEVVDRRTLLADIWGYLGFEPRSNPVEVYVSALRRKLGHDRIETVRGRGYRLRVRRTASRVPRP